MVFVAAKTRVAPSTPMTIPRLELLAILILARVVSAVQEALNPVTHIEEVFCSGSVDNTILDLQNSSESYSASFNNC